VPPVNPAWIAALVALITLVLAIIGWTGRTLWHIFRRADQFLEDWNGIPADHRGHEERPGVLERLAQLERGLADVQAQVHLNSGHSLKDVVTRTEAAVANNTSQLTALKQVVDRLEGAP
jgi:hypothetical protein